MGTLYATGDAYNYALGTGDTIDKQAFISVLGGVARARSGDGFCLAIADDGTLWGWGKNISNQLGISTSSDTPAITQLGSASNWAHVAGAEAHAAAIRTDGTIWFSGLNPGYRGIGWGDTQYYTTWTQIGSATDWASVACGTLVAFAIKSDGSLWVCGANNAGVLGLNEAITVPNYFAPTFQQIGSATNWQKISARNYTVVALKTDGTLWSWGDSYSYATGQNTTTDLILPTQIGSATDWADCAIGYRHGAAIKSDGTLWAWGAGASGQLGQGAGDVVDKNVPTQVGTGTDWVSVYVGRSNTYAIKSDGTAWAWGLNNTGQLGIDSLDTAYTPTEIPRSGIVDIYPAWDAAFVLVDATETGSITAPVQITVLESTGLSAPVRFTVTNPTGQISAPVQMSVSSQGSLSAAIRMAVTDTLTNAWSAIVKVGGSTISSRVVGSIQIDAEEGAPRLANVSYLPTTGAVSLSALLGAAVEISLVRYVDGLPVPVRLFTGLVDESKFDPINGKISLQCSDNLKAKISRLSITAIDALTANVKDLDYLPGALGDAPADLWDYAQARMECVDGLLDAGVYGQLRVTSFAGSGLIGSFSESDLNDESLSIELPQRGDIINQVNVEFDFRRYRCRERRAGLGWANSIFGPSALASGYQSPAISTVRSAVEGAGWEVLSQSYQAGYTYVAGGAPPGETGSDWWYVGTADACGSMSALLGQRHAQSFTEAYRISIDNTPSQSTYGIQSRTLRGALDSDWQPQNWEAWGEDVPNAIAADVDYSGSADRTLAEDTFATLAMMAVRTIRQSHRTCRVQFAVPCLAEIDLTHTASINTDRIQASGKVARYQHLLNTLTGEATTTITVAVAGVGATGSVTNSSLNNLPDAPQWGPGIDDAEAWVEDKWQMDIGHLTSSVGAVSWHDYSEDLAGYLVNAPERLTMVNFTTSLSVSFENPYYNAAYIYPATGFRVILPGVADNYREPPQINPITEARQVFIASGTPITLTV